MKYCIYVAFLVNLLLAACSRSNIRTVVQSLAEQPVDTVGYASQQWTLEAFSAVDVDCFADVRFQKSSAYGLEVKAPAEVLENMVVKVTDDAELQVSLKHHFKMPEKTVAVLVVKSPCINRFCMSGGKCLRLGQLTQSTPLQVELNGIGSVIADSLVLPQLQLKLDGAGHIAVNGIRTETLSVRVNGAGSARLTGTAGEASLQASGACHIDATELSCKAIPRITTDGASQVVH